MKWRRPYWILKNAIGRNFAHPPEIVVLDHYELISIDLKKSVQKFHLKCYLANIPPDYRYVEHFDIATRTTLRDTHPSSTVSLNTTIHRPL